MKKIKLIAQSELNNLFYSPIAWILLIIFMVQCSLSFTDAVNNYLILAKYHKLYPAMSLDPATTYLMSNDQVGMFTQIVSKLYLYIPLVTMGLISREVSSGTIRLLYSSPINTAQIVLGKFVAMMVYSLILLGILGLFCITVALTVPFADTGLLLTALLGFFLLLCAYSAIGLFMSCLTSYQVVAALTTLAVFAALQYLGKIGQGIDFVRELTYYLSLGSRTQSMFIGLINTRDVLYFIVITIVFLTFSFFRLQADQQSQSLIFRVSRYIGFTVVAALLITFTSRPSFTGYLDATDAKVNTIPSVTQSLLKSTGKTPLEITAYVNLLDFSYATCSPEMRNTYLRFWEKYIRFKPDMRFKYVYYYDTTAYLRRAMARVYKGKTVEQVAEEYAKTNHISLDRFLTPKQAQAIPGLKTENGRLLMQFSYKGKTAGVRLFEDNRKWPSEDQIASAIKRVTQQAPPPDMVFLKGGFERNSDVKAIGERDYSRVTTNKLVRASLLNIGFNVGVVSRDQEMPTDAAALVIADPKTAFEAGFMNKLQKYIANGGNLLITGEPGKQDVLNPLLETLGVQMKDGVLVQPNENEVPNLVTPVPTAFTADMSSGTANLYNSRQPVFLAGSATLEYDTAGGNSAGKFDVQPLLTLNGNASWLKKGQLVNDSAKVEFSPGDVLADHFTPALGLTRIVNGKQQRIAVIGDADFMSNNIIKLHPENNVPFCLALFKWLNNGKFPVEVASLRSKDFTIPNDRQLATANILFTWLLPGLILISGTVLLLRRKRS